MTLRNKLRTTLTAGLLGLVTACGNDTDHVWIVRPNAAERFTLTRYAGSGSEPRSLFLFDLEGDGKIDQAVATRGIECSNIGYLRGIPKEHVTFYTAPGTQPSDYVISGVAPQPLTETLVVDFLNPSQKK